MKNKILILISSAFLIGAGVILPLVVGFGKSGRGISVANRDYSLISKKEIEAKLIKDFPMEGKIKLSDKDRVFTVDLASISAQVDIEQTASNLLFRRLKEGLVKYLEAFFKDKNFDLVINVDEEKLGKVSEEICTQIEKPFVPSEIILENGKLSIKEGQIGKSVNQERLKEIILESLRKYKLEDTLEIPIEDIGKLPSKEEEKASLEGAKKFLKKKVIFKNEEVEVEVDEKILISWMAFGNGIEAEKVSDYVDSLEQSLKKEAQDAAFKFENGKVLAFEPAREGYYLDAGKLKNLIERNFLSWQNSSETKIIEQLSLIRTAPKISNDQVNNLGIKELLGKGTSSFRHSTTIRNYNVEKGASIINRILVAPGETFSFIKNLGEVSLASGYKKAYIIREGKTELDVGGGICQVSTTLFRAMLDAGLDITQRQAHAYRVSYYEEDSKPGFDATVFIPNPDLRFVNDTGNYVLIQSYYDGVNKKLTYEIYGTSDGRKVEISNYKQWGASPAPPDVWIDDPTLPAGKVVQDEHKIPGLKTAFDWTVTKNGEVIHQKTFASTYVPWAAVYRRGTGI